MTVEQAIADRLSSDAGVSALVGTRVWQLKLPQSPTLPAVVVQLISDPSEHHLRGEVGQTRSRVQVDCYGKDSGVADPYEAVTDVAEAVSDALCGVEPFTVAGAGSPSVDRYVQFVRRLSRMSMHEGDELRVVRVTQDFLVVSQVQ